jgi:Ca2+-binding RTX toxin-like protein
LRRHPRQATTPSSASTPPDVLQGGAGNDTLDAGAGDDTYIYARGDGNDVIAEHYGNLDKLVLHGIAPG